MSAFDCTCPAFRLLLSAVVQRINVWCICLALTALLPCMNAGAAQQDIHALRSAYLFYFSSLIEWPGTTQFAGNELRLCVLTRDTKDRYQLSTIDGKNTGEYALKISMMNQEEPDTVTLDRCHMVYLSGDFPLPPQHVFKSGVLLVTEGKVENRGDIHLFTDNNKLMFEINIENLIRKRFKASSRLLRLSREEKG